VGSGTRPTQKQFKKKEKKRKEIVSKQQLDTVSYPEEQKISAGLHLENKNAREIEALEK